MEFSVWCALLEGRENWLRRATADERERWTPAGRAGQRCRVAGGAVRRMATATSVLRRALRRSAAVPRAGPTRAGPTRAGPTRAGSARRTAALRRAAALQWLSAIPVSAAAAGIEEARAAVADRRCARAGRGRCGRFTCLGHRSAQWREQLAALPEGVRRSICRGQGLTRPGRREHRPRLPGRASCRYWDRAHL